MAMVGVIVACYRWIQNPSRLAWSEGRGHLVLSIGGHSSTNPLTTN